MANTTPPTVCGWKYYEQGQKLNIFYDPEEPECNNLSQRELMKKWGYAFFFTTLAILAIYLFLRPGKK